MAKAKPEEQEVFAAELARQIPNENDFNVRMAIIQIMGTMKAPSANAILFAGMKDPEPEIRSTCCESWGKRPGRNRHACWPRFYRAIPIWTCGWRRRRRFPAPETKKPSQLWTSTDDPDPGMQHCAVVSLKKVTGKDLGNDVNAWRQLNAANRSANSLPIVGESIVANLLDAPVSLKPHWMRQPAHFIDCAASNR